MEKPAKGFTFIEIMVVVTIAMVLTGFGIASYNNFREKQTVIREAEKFATELRLVQKRADAGETMTDCGVGDPLVSYTVSHVSATKARVSQLCGAGSTHTYEIDLGNNVQLTPFATITFPVLSGTVTGATISMDTLGNVCNPDATVTVSSAGEVTANKGGC